MVDLPPPRPALVQADCPEEARSLDRRVQCGFVRVPLNRSRPAGRSLRIYFERYPHHYRSRPRSATVVSIEGGPGYPTTDDRAARVAVWRPISGVRDLLLVDLRGTGRSGLLGCAAFARSTLRYARRAGRCATQVGPKRDFYSTSQSVQDIEDVLLELGAGRVDLYGDSYGTYAAQAFALRYPERMRSLVLDGTYPLPGTDPAWSDLLASIRRGLRLSCARHPGCPAEVRGVDPVSLVAQFAARVRARPIRGVAPDSNGTPIRVRLDEDALVWIASSTYYFPGVYRDLPAAIYAAQRGDTRPILRLAAETLTIDVGPSPSEALYLAVICHDYPQLWDSASPLEQRRAEARSRIAAYPAGTFSPFTPSAWTGTDYEGVFACVRWPGPARPDPPDPPGAAYPDVPTLVLNGDLDTITASSGAREVGNRFPRSTFVELRNSFHVTVLRDYDRCASRLYLRFVRSLDPGDTSCAQQVAEPHVVAAFPRSLGTTRAARPARGDHSQVRDRRLAAAAAAAVADVIARWWVNIDGTSLGLRGGRWSYEGNSPIVFHLNQVEFVPGVPVSGTVRWRPDQGTVMAQVRAREPSGTTGTLRMRWSLHAVHARASLTGQVGGRTLRATMLAP
ncbi:MAG TPA: alpha/beta hydrolase [Gaiellaceae bacterium]|nr:alpha/beta hydrolase [Gaiellaceae bacterium]